jgi:hypothetical protein
VERLTEARVATQVYWQYIEERRVRTARDGRRSALAAEEVVNHAG